MMPATMMPAAMMANSQSVFDPHDGALSTRLDRRGNVGQVTGRVRRDPG